jgi:hypothetical protein
MGLGTLLSVVALIGLLAGGCAQSSGRQPELASAAPAASTASMEAPRLPPAPAPTTTSIPPQAPSSPTRDRPLEPPARTSPHPQDKPPGTIARPVPPPPPPAQPPPTQQKPLEQVEPPRGPQLTDLAIAALIEKASRASYPGNCACPDNVDRAGRRCGARSAYSRPGGRSPMCYERDVPAAMIAAERRRRAF